MACCASNTFAAQCGCSGGSGTSRHLSSPAYCDFLSGLLCKSSSLQAHSSDHVTDLSLCCFCMLCQHQGNMLTTTPCRDVVPLHLCSRLAPAARSMAAAVQACAPSSPQGFPCLSMNRNLDIQPQCRWPAAMCTALLHTDSLGSAQNVIACKSLHGSPGHCLGLEDGRHVRHSPGMKHGALTRMHKSVNRCSMQMQHR